MDCRQKNVFLRQVFSVAVVSAALLLAPFPAAAKWAALVMDANTGEVLDEVNADTKNYPASLTKMMTLYLVFEALDQGAVTLDQKITVSNRAARQPPSHLALSPGDTITIEEAIMALVTKSANDVATAVAEAMAGSERKFAMRMTAKARSLGMSNTTFRNASGLPHRSQLSTARDMATLARSLLGRFPGYYDYFSTREFTFRGDTFKNHNDLLRKYEGTDGIKTGYIRASGFNLVASVKRDGNRLIGVIFGGRSASHRNKYMVSMLEDGFVKVNGAPSRTTRAKAEEPARQKEARRAPTVRKDDDNTNVDKTRVWGVQVGAYYEQNRAHDTAVEATDDAPSLLSQGRVKVEPLRTRKRTVYRARVIGLTKKEAYAACRVLRTKGRQCMELKGLENVELASAE
ncbi:MAG: D-alanyl-D-alanine carboxypeptidase [Rhodospirillales bacterium]|nr:D-alanyl-D-alanine carboxypeptidase [Rhodospirillales bacterium]MCW8862019.1 D-alanyl-D-alanine carboxypeptidase [Rhodospirillales bacterium]MCW8953078.1 D-alanyl-D-alanine carboxypeptidase [Rhodospirillales bacterium]MCW8970393.1 D-alanyl-D-alanine carboxypeptidase [Rhodospirillales bacterium]MCW9002415.1 D-alanyl-D-alanine carboxypeptidase [Rhodospirillales bacterium]